MYEEYAISERLRRVARCTWHQVTEQAHITRVVPDACTDIIWNGRRLSVAGPDTIPMPTPLAAGERFVAIRFAPGCGPRLIGAPGTALRNARVELEELWGDRAKLLADALAQARDVATARELLEAAVGMQLLAAEQPDALALETARRLSGASEAPSVAKLAGDLGITERQLLRRANFAFGYGPKQLARILRFQRFMTALRRRPAESLALLALECGFVDQAHLTHEIAELSGSTPGRLQAELIASDV
jgi:AraC-like DNA-binding protein